MKNKSSVLSFEEALKIIMDSVVPLGYEDIPVTEVYGRVLYEDIASDIMIPPLDESAMDGYAVIADDTKGASETNPVTLKITGEVQAGASAAGKKVTKGTAVRIMTGAHIPEGADAIVRFEDTEEDGNIVKIFVEMRKLDNYRKAGENIAKGETVLKKGERLTSADAGMLASINRGTVRVYRQPAVSIISTGDELADIGENIRHGQIMNVNRYTMFSESKRYGGIPEYLGIAKDTPGGMKDIFEKAMEADIVISTGGVSKGKYDFVKEILTGLDVEILFEFVNIKPGKPLSFGIKGSKLIFGLPGNPVPAMLSFIEFVRPALLKLMGAKRITKPVVKAVLEEDIYSVKAYHMIRAFFTIKNDEFHVTPTANQKPAMLRSMSDANCLIVLPENILQVKAGEKVTIQLIDHDEI